MGSLAPVFAAVKARRQMQQGTKLPKGLNRQAIPDTQTAGDLVSRDLGYNVASKHDYHTMSRTTTERHPDGTDGAERPPYNPNNVF